MPYLIHLICRGQGRVRQQYVNNPDGKPLVFKTQRAAEEMAENLRFIKNLQIEYFPDTAPQFTVTVHTSTS